MNAGLGMVLGVLQITILDLTLSGDNIGVIALVTRTLPEKSARLASMLGIAGALVMRILFACILTYVLAVSWLPIRLLGGLLLIKITWDFIKPKQEEEHAAKEAQALKDAVFTIIIADVSMSLDNVLALAAAADGKMLLLVFGILLNIPIIFFGSKFVAEMMNKFEIVIYIGGALLAHTSFKMIFEDQLFNKYIHLSAVAESIIPWVMAIMVIGYGLFIMKASKEEATVH